MTRVQMIKALLDDAWSWRETSDYRHMERSIWMRDEEDRIDRAASLDFKEVREAKWYKKAPHYRPTGPSRYHVGVRKWNADGEKGKSVHGDFGTIKEALVWMDAMVAVPYEEYK